LLAGGWLFSAQNLENKEFIGKIMQNKDLEARFSER
jgi:hypothetical protein